MPRTAVTRINGAFQVQANTATNLKNNGFYAPQLTTAQIAGIPVGTLMNGAIVYNTTTGSYQIYQARDFAAPTVYTWANLISSPMKAYVDDDTAVANIPGGAAVKGAMYYNTTNDTIKVYLNNAWVTVTTA